MSTCIRILSYNIHKGFTFGNTRFLLDEIRNGIRTMNADMVFLQEVVGENKKHQHRIDNWAPQQLEYLADDVWPHYAYGKNAIYSHGHHGNAILSHYPFEAFNNIDVSCMPTSARGILVGKINHPNLTHNIYVICLHFGLFGFERRTQLKTLCNQIQSAIPTNAPLIIAGDFNDWRGDSVATLKELHMKEAHLEKHQRPAKTFPAYFPLLAMDRIYYRHLDLLDAKVLHGQPWNKMSDHCALYAEFCLR